MRAVLRAASGATLALLSIAAFAAEHNPLLPRPQKIRYGSGTLAVRGLSVRLAPGAGAEERFTAEQLASSLEKIAGARVAVSNGGRSGIALQRTGAVDALPAPGETGGPNGREAYFIKVTPKGVEVRGTSSAGVYYGAQTLLQLVEGTGAGARLPEVEIEDWPSLPYRGVMIDMSHGPLPTEAEVKRQIDFLARWKNNQYYFYSEASIALDGYPVLNADAQFSQDEVRRIVAFGRERHIDVVPCVELYGHLHDLFRQERYSGLSILPHGSEFDPRNPQAAALLRDWVKQLTDIFPSAFFHIGFDETREAPQVVGNDRTLPRDLYLKQFQLVSGLVRERGKTLLVWSDMFSRYPNLIPQIPGGTIVVPWGYDRKVYEPYWKPFENSPLPRFVATGVSIWLQVAPAFDLSFDNIDNFLAAGRPHGVTGIINTIWTDGIAVLMRPSFPGMAYGAIAAWQADPVNRGTFFSEYARILYGAKAADEAARALTAIDKSELELARAVGSGWEETLPALWDEALAPAHLKRAQAKMEQFRQTRLLAEEAGAHFAQALRLGADADTLSDLLLEARLLDYVGMKNVYAAELADFWKKMGPHPDRKDLSFYVSKETVHTCHSRMQDLMDTSGDLEQAFRAAWLRCYTPYRLGMVLGKWQAEFEYWWKVRRRFDDFQAGFHAGDALPPLESFNPGH